MMMVCQTLPAPGPNLFLPKGHDVFPWSSEYHPHIFWLKHPMVRGKKNIPSGKLTVGP